MRARMGPLITMRGAEKWVEVDMPCSAKAGSQAASTAARSTGR